MIALCRTYHGSLRGQVESLRHFPKRCLLAPENGFFGKEEIRQLLFLKYPSPYRVLFTVEGGYDTNSKYSQWDKTVFV